MCEKEVDTVCLSVCVCVCDLGLVSVLVWF